ncbi:epidermal growth factor-like protein 7 isoform X2 [Octodon degus]|uniref:Epidermal growth factor-like protein 7 isoform X2 n=1 Tax=Octodon degus TaxID=10160 RepID=A0A6P6D7S5_OCTDE|nr:epidermal growth factor-like protein 7 isoform X2 [Octodon degus]
MGWQDPSGLHPRLPYPSLKPEAGARWPCPLVTLRAQNPALLALRMLQAEPSGARCPCSHPSRPLASSEQAVRSRGSGQRDLQGTKGCVLCSRPPRGEGPPPGDAGMWGSRELLLLWFLVLAAGGTGHAYRPRLGGSLLCSSDPTPPPAAGYVLWRGPGQAPSLSPSHSVCTSPSSLPAMGTGPAAPTAICQPPCGNGGSCVRPGHCRCPAGWKGSTCHTDVDECGSGGAGCPQGCVNTVGSYWCQCWEGHSPSADGTRCLPTAEPPRVTPNTVAGVDTVARAEVQRLQARVEALEQKLQLVLAPLHSLISRAPDEGPQDPGSLLARSLQQLDRIDSLSEQISFLEEQLGSCECRHLPALRGPGSSRGGGRTQEQSPQEQPQAG